MSAAVVTVALERAHSDPTPVGSLPSRDGQHGGATGWREAERRWRAPADELRPVLGQEERCAVAGGTHARPVRHGTADKTRDARAMQRGGIAARGRTLGSRAPHRGCAAPCAFRARGGAGWRRRRSPPGQPSSGPPWACRVDVSAGHGSNGSAHKHVSLSGSGLSHAAPCQRGMSERPEGGRRQARRRRRQKGDWSAHERLRDALCVRPREPQVGLEPSERPLLKGGERLELLHNSLSRRRRRTTGRRAESKSSVTSRIGKSARERRCEVLDGG